MVLTLALSLMVTATWTNGAGDGLWSTAGNWSGGVVPGAADAVIFDGATSNANCAIDAAVTLTSITIAASYTGTVTAAAVTISLGSFTQAGASFFADLATMDVDGAFTVNDGDFHAPTGTLTIGGDLTSGTFFTIDHNNGTVVLDGFNQSILGQDWNFFNLSKTASVTQTLYFEDILGAPVEVFGTLTLRGTPGYLLSLRSTTPGSVWYLNSEGPRDIAYVDVKDASNASPTTIDAGSNSVNSGNNWDWIFGAPPPGGDDDDRCGSLGLDLLLPLGLLLLARRA